MSTTDPCYQEINDLIQNDILRVKLPREDTSTDAETNSISVFSQADLDRVSDNLYQETEIYLKFIEKDISTKDEFKNISLSADLTECINNKLFYVAQYAKYVYVPTIEEQKNKLLDVFSNNFHPLIRNFRFSDHILGLPTDADLKYFRRGQILEELFNLTYETPYTLYTYISEVTLKKRLPFTISISDRGVEFNIIKEVSDDGFKRELEEKDKKRDKFSVIRGALNCLGYYN